MEEYGATPEDEGQPDGLRAGYGRFAVPAALLVIACAIVLAYSNSFNVPFLFDEPAVAVESEARVVVDAQKVQWLADQLHVFQLHPIGGPTPAAVP